jgi:hypothetical protein
MLIARASGWIGHINVEKLRFRLIEVRDEAGLLLRLRIEFQDMAEVQQWAIAEPAFQELVQTGLLQNRLPTYLAKKIAAYSLSDLSDRTLSRALHLIQVCRWKTNQQEGVGDVPVLFLERRFWMKALIHYASRQGITIVPVHPALNLRAVLRRRLPRAVVTVGRFLRYSRSRRYMLSSFKRIALPTRGALVANGPTALLGQDSGPRVAVDYLGNLNLNHSELYTDLFFWQQSSLSGSDVLVMFGQPWDPLDQEKWAELSQHGMRAVALHPGAVTIPAVPSFTHHPRVNRKWRSRLRVVRNGREAAWLDQQVADYDALRAYWTDVFATCNIKVYTTWWKYDATHCAIADALESLGGITAIYQRAYESHPAVDTTVSSDIVFGFSQEVAEVERRANSTIRYHVTTGYPGDHRFPLLRNSAQTVRDTLKRHGAKRILAFFDEGSTDDSRWHTGHQFMRENYLFLLEKVLAEPWFGMVIKPKGPSTLRRRLGPVAELLQRAEATGRCYVYKGGAGHGFHTPAEAALAADIAIHGHLCGATAGLEAALAGVPTLLLDREGWTVSPLYRLGVGRVVFTDWEGLWNALVEHWASPGGIPGFGDWSPMLNELDPFRDGRAAERMGTYIQWLIEGFKAGLDRETVMADAAERYCEIWGKDKVTQVNSGPLVYIS